LKKTLIKKLCCLGIGLGLASGCCSTKMMEFTYQQLDTVKTTQAELLRRVDEFARVYESDRDERLRIQAETAFRLQELRDALEILGYRVDDSAQLLLQRSAPVVPPAFPPVDTAAGQSEGGTRGAPEGGVPVPQDTSAADSSVTPSVADDEAGRLFQACSGVLFEIGLLLPETRRARPRGEVVPGAHLPLSAERGSGASAGRAPESRRVETRKRWTLLRSFSPFWPS
jgi:hypothetical protein